MAIAMNEPALVSLIVSMLGQLMFTRWALLSGWATYEPIELWLGRLGMAAMAIGSGLATYFVCSTPVLP
jgi:hypothetical protein